MWLEACSPRSGLSSENLTSLRAHRIPRVLRIEHIFVLERQVHDGVMDLPFGDAMPVLATQTPGNAF